jgi:threonine dehydrogenase-like Zn-dependent dehydrogenase
VPPQPASSSIFKSQSLSMPSHTSVALHSVPAAFILRTISAAPQLRSCAALDGTSGWPQNDGVRALVYDGAEARLAEVPEPKAQGGQVLLRPRLAGICNTDLEIVRGYLGFSGILGHELVAVVEEGPPTWRGRRVVAEINFACGSCATCKQGLGRHCPTRTVMGIVGQDGAFAERVVAPLDNLHAVPDELADEEAVFVEPLAAAHEILEQVRPASGTATLVLGDGKLGLLVAQVLERAGLRVLAVGKHRDKLEILGSRGIETRLLRDWQPDASADLTVEATGSAAGFEQAVRATRPRGTLVLKSTVAERLQVDLAPLVIHEIQLIGSRCGPFEPALAALAAGDVEVEPLISERWPLSRADEALRRAAEPGLLKVLLDCSG